MGKNSRHRPHCREAGSAAPSGAICIVGDWPDVSVPIMGSSILSPEAGTLGLSVSLTDRTPQWWMDRKSGRRSNRSRTAETATSDPGRSQSPKRRQGGWRLPAGRQFAQKLCRRLEDVADCSLDGLLRAGGGRLHPADLADILARSRLDLFCGGLGLKTTKGCDVSTHEDQATGTGSYLPPPVSEWPHTPC